MTFTAVVDTLQNYRDHLAQFHTALGEEDMGAQAQELQLFFQQTLWPQITQLESPPSQAQWQSATTEIHRHMRLLAVEVRFIQSARHGQTYQQRLGQIKQRLEQLQGFTRVLMALCQPS